MEVTEKIKCIDCLTNKAVELDLVNNDQQLVEYLSKQGEGELFVGPGLTDIQINGFAGVDFNTFPITEEGMLKAINVLIAEGVTTIFPTVITNSDASIIALLNNINQLCKDNPAIEPYIGGIHLEGPFISTSDQARGAHDLQYIKAPDWELFQTFQKASGNRIRIVTICPEWDSSVSFIEKCVDNDIVVALGHTNASPEHVKRAVKAGASLSTHLGNGAPLMLPRNSNFIFEQLAQDSLYASLIADGFHLPESFMKIALQIKKERAILVSDSTMFAGMPSGVYESHIGGKVMLEENGRLCMHSNPELMAGAALSVLACMNTILKAKLSNVKKTWELASTNANRLVGITNAYLTNTQSADFVIYRYFNNEISIISVFKHGKRIYLRNSI